MAKKTVQKKHQLTVEKRKILGRKVKKLRQEGILPANIYGKGIKSLSVQLQLKDFTPVYQAAGETGIVQVKVDKETKVRPVLIHNVQRDPILEEPLHADFYQVDLKQKITSNIPVVMIGESPATTQKIGILIQALSEVEVEALPTNLPDKFEIDISSLEKIDDAVTAAELKAPAGVKILTSEKEILAKVEPPTKEEEVKPAEEIAVEGEEAEEKKEETKEEVKEEAEKSKPAEEKKTPEKK